MLRKKASKYIAKESLGASRNDKKYMTMIITADRVFAFVALLILNMLQPFPDGIKSHWRTDSHFMHRADNVPLVMPRDEFRAISKCLC